MIFLQRTLIFIFIFTTTIVLASDDILNPIIDSESVNETEVVNENSDEIAILWTTGEKDVFTKVVYVYCLNSKKKEWWNHVTLIVWGPSSLLLSGDKEMQEKIKELLAVGVEIVACKWCADEYGVSEKLNEIGIEVKYMGEPLTDYIKKGVEVLVF